MKESKINLVFCFLFIVGIITLSCDDNKVNENSSKTLSAKDVANIHNEVLASFYQNQLRFSNQDLKISDIHNSVVKILKENHSDFFADIEQEIPIEPAFANIALRSSLRSSDSSTDGLFLIIEEAFNNLVSMNVYSASFIADMKKIITTDNDLIIDDLQIYAEKNKLTKEERLLYERVYRGVQCIG
jgi:hypothetical protein